MCVHFMYISYLEGGFTPPKIQTHWKAERLKEAGTSLPGSCCASEQIVFMVFVFSILYFV